MDIFSNLIGKGSVWVNNLTYELSEHKLVINLVDTPINMNVIRQIIIPDFISFDETIEEIDNDLVDSIIGIHWLEDAASICVRTDTREIIVKTSSQPFAINIT